MPILAAGVIVALAIVVGPSLGRMLARGGESDPVGTVESGLEGLRQHQRAGNIVDAALKGSTAPSTDSRSADTGPASPASAPVNVTVNATIPAASSEAPASVAAAPAAAPKVALLSELVEEGATKPDDAVELSSGQYYVKFADGTCRTFAAHGSGKPVLSNDDVAKLQANCKPKQR